MCCPHGFGSIRISESFISFAVANTLPSCRVEALKFVFNFSTRGRVLFMFCMSCCNFSAFSVCTLFSLLVLTSALFFIVPIIMRGMPFLMAAFYPVHSVLTFVPPIHGQFSGQVAGLFAFLPVALAGRSVGFLFVP